MENTNSNTLLTTLSRLNPDMSMTVPLVPVAAMTEVCNPNIHSAVDPASKLFPKIPRTAVG